MHPRHTRTLLRLSSWRKLDRQLLMKDAKNYWVVDMISAVGGFEDANTSDVHAAIATVSWFACFVGPRDAQVHSNPGSYPRGQTRNTRIVVVAVRFLPGGKVVKLAGITNCRKQHIFQQDILNILF